MGVVSPVASGSAVGERTLAVPPAAAPVPSVATAPVGGGVVPVPVAAASVGSGARAPGLGGTGDGHCSGGFPPLPDGLAHALPLPAAPAPNLLQQSHQSPGCPHFEAGRLAYPTSAHFGRPNSSRGVVRAMSPTHFYFGFNDYLMIICITKTHVETQ